MGKFDGILLATDLDGTLLRNDKTVSKENAEAIRYFQSEGGIFTVATGRYPEFLKTYVNSFVPNECVIALNGGMVYDLSDGKTLFVVKLSETLANEIIEYAYSEIEDKIDSVHINDETESYIYDGSLRGDMCKFIIIMNDEASCEILRDKLREKYSDTCEICRSWNVGLEVYSKDGGKGNCVEYIRKNINPKIKKTVCVGDYENDISMLKAADIGYAVANASPYAKKAADKVLDTDNEHHAIARVIEDLEKKEI